MGDNPDDISENMNEVETEIPPVTSTEIDEESQVKQPETSTVIPVKNIIPVSVPVPPTSDVKVEEGTSPPKSIKLVSLRYNYSDDEDDETREDRKCRIVSMKSVISPV
jgi:hypothetical protein